MQERGKQDNVQDKLESKKKMSLKSRRVKVKQEKINDSIASLEAQLEDKKRQIEKMKKQNEEQEKIVDELIKMVKQLKNNTEEQDMIQQRNLLIKQNQSLSEERLKYKKIDAQSKAEVNKLVKDLEQIIQLLNQQLSKASQEDSQVKQQLQQEIAEKDRTIDSLNAGVKALAKKEEAIKKRVEALLEDSQSQKKTIAALENELKNVRLNSSKQKAAYLLQFINSEANSVFQFDKAIGSKQEFLLCCSYMQKSLISSNILNSQQKVRNFIINAISNSEKRAIAKTRLLFKYDQFHKGFGNYIINYTGPLLLLMKLSNGRICGGFCPKLDNDSESDNTILFTYLDASGRIFYKHQGARRGCAYSNNSLTFGCNQLILMNNQAKHFRISTNQFGPRYFKMKQLEFLDDDSSNVIAFEEMELHVVEF